MENEKKEPISLGYMNSEWSYNTLIEPMIKITKALGFQWVQIPSDIEHVEKFYNREFNVVYAVDSSD